MDVYFFLGGFFTILVFARLSFRKYLQSTQPTFSSILILLAFECHDSQNRRDKTLFAMKKVRCFRDVMNGWPAVVLSGCELTHF